jgi:hypothetical protein
MIEAAQIDLARSVPVWDELQRRGIDLKPCGAERVGPCPDCGGNDRFAVNIKKNLFNCRGCGAKGGDSIDLVQFLDTSRRFSALSRAD